MNNKLREYLVIDFSRAFEHVEQKTLLSERGLAGDPRIFSEMLTQVFDYLSTATPSHNPFENRSLQPYLCVGLVPGIRTDDHQIVEELKVAFSHLYVGVREEVESLLCASQIVRTYGGFGYVLSNRLSNHTVVLRYLADPT